MQIPGQTRNDIESASQVNSPQKSFFFYPDFTVGSGIAPDQPLVQEQGSWTFHSQGKANCPLSTTGGEFLPPSEDYVQPHYSR